VSTRAASLGSPLLLALVLLFRPALAGAQPHPNKDNGFSAEKAFHVGDVDSVNALNGNLVITVPLGLAAASPTG
jgi:hypothetical protein